MRHPLTTDDFLNMELCVNQIPTGERGFNVKFLDYNLIATGHHRTGVKIWSYPLLQLQFTLPFNKGYVTTLVPFSKAPLIAVANDTDPNMCIFNYVTGEKRWDSKDKCQDTYCKTICCIGSEIVFFKSSKEGQLQLWNIQTDEKVTVPVDPKFEYNHAILADETKIVMIGSEPIETMNDEIATIEMWDISAFKLTLLWQTKFQRQKYDRNMCIAGRKIYTKGKKCLIEFSFQGEELKRINLDRSITGSWNIFKYVPDDLIIGNNSSSVVLVDLKRQKVISLESTDTKSYLHRLDIHPKGTVMAVIRECQSVYLYKLRNDITHDIELFFTRLRSSSHYFDVEVNMYH
jgi:WD40 repeat protein